MKDLPAILQRGVKAASQRPHQDPQAGAGITRQDLIVAPADGRLKGAEERRRLADIIAGTQIGTWEWDLVTNALTLNPRWAEMIGRRLEDLEPTTIETWQMFCHPEDLARSESEVARHLGGETDQYRCVLRMLHDDGRWIWVQDQGRVSARDAHGRPLRMVGIHEDIIERKNAELELIAREAFEHELLELASAFVEVYDEDLDPLVNRALERLGGLTRSDRAYVFRVDRVADTMSNSHEWAAPGIEPMIGHSQQMPIEHFSASRQLLESGQTVVVPRVAELPDAWAMERETLQFQAILSVLLVPLLQDERLIGFVGFDAVQAPRDWSEAEVRFLRVFSSILVSAFERARIYSELRDSNRRYDQLAVQSRIVSWEVDAEGLYTYLSPAVEAVWGYRREALVDRKHCFDLVPELLRDSVKADVMSGFARLDHFTDLVNPMRCADGSTIWVLTNGAPVVAEDGRLLGYRGTDVDITERYRAQEQLQAALIGAKERETIGHLASGVAHDFNNLLGVIDANLYYLEAILSGEQGDPEVAQVIEETQSALGQAKVVTSGMLSLSRAGGIVPESVALEKTIRELVTILRQLLPAKINLNLDLEPGLAAMSNSAFLQAALLNLVLNARDAMPDGGDLLIAARTVAWDALVPLAVGRLDPGEYVQIRVVDTGCGMADEVLRGSSSRCSRPRPNNAGMGSACSWCRSSSCAPVRVWPSPRRSVGAPSFVS
ncbi:PAS domain S-box protein [Thiocapsa sp.]|uniref:PAS domain S-box protein n=1 Tax=Thiocapsa sp. TaxID=2024551 RepID=UPI001BD05500